MLLHFISSSKLVFLILWTAVNWLMCNRVYIVHLTHSHLYVWRWFRYRRISSMLDSLSCTSCWPPHNNLQAAHVTSAFVLRRTAWFARNYVLCTPRKTCFLDYLFQMTFPGFPGFLCNVISKYSDSSLYAVQSNFGSQFTAYYSVFLSEFY